MAKLDHSLRTTSLHVLIYMVINTKQYTVLNTALPSVTICVGNKVQFIIKNKPAAQAAGADPSRCNFINRQNTPFQQNRRNS